MSAWAKLLQKQHATEIQVGPSSSNEQENFSFLFSLWALLFPIISSSSSHKTSKSWNSFIFICRNYLKLYTYNETYCMGLRRKMACMQKQWYQCICMPCLAKLYFHRYAQHLTLSLSHMHHICPHNNTTPNSPCLVYLLFYCIRMWPIYIWTQFLPGLKLHYIMHIYNICPVCIA